VEPSLSAWVRPAGPARPDERAGRRSGLPGPRLGTPPLNRLYLYLTDGCNLACRHCWISPAHDPGGQRSTFLEPALIEQAIGEALPLGLESVKLTGGEPLLHPQFADIVGLVGQHGLGLSLETNGTLLSPPRGPGAGRRRGLGLGQPGRRRADHPRLAARGEIAAITVGPVHR
jgi:sulfatase maturation enzyme AslB (radical SAM superfamily)